MPRSAQDSKPICHESGFSLLEAVLATAIVSIGFASIFSLAVFSERSVRDTIQREKLEMLASQMLEVIEADVDNVSLYAVDFTNGTDCDNAAAGDTSLLYNVKIDEWCNRLTGELGAAKTNDVREINYDDSSGTKLINIILESQNGDVQVLMNRSFGG